MTSDEVFGAPCWVSLATHDLGAAQDFYGAVFGWSFRRTRLGEGFRVASLDGLPVAGLGTANGQAVGPVAWTPYFAVPDADVTAARIRERGATVAVGPLALGTGRAVIAADPAGAVFGVWEGEVMSDWIGDPDGSPAWLRLRTQDAFAAAVFYGEVLDWACERPGCCDVAYEHDHVVVRRGGATVARIDAGATKDAVDALARPRWDVHFAVADLDAATGTAVHLGAAVVSLVETSPFGRRVTLRDPEGALFSVSEETT
ncbi:VOC family protein [Streptomyces sp. NRRL F-2580]|uniref:VOC family protein n=1 Tax=Streptomyces sp. NRRL F-2580 TaxID=1463841 RepID=UPI0006905C87|nr:VOC family protein [Streptomyces sp. NRRL F-2580]